MSQQFPPDHQYEFVCRNIKRALGVIDDPKYDLRGAVAKLREGLHLIKAGRHATGRPFACDGNNRVSS